MVCPPLSSSSSTVGRIPLQLRKVGLYLFSQLTGDLDSDTAGSLRLLDSTVQSMVRQTVWVQIYFNSVGSKNCGVDHLVCLHHGKLSVSVTEMVKMVACSAIKPQCN